MILLVAGTRPELIKMEPVYRALKAQEAQVRLVVLGQQKDLIGHHLAGYLPEDRWKLELPSEAYAGSLDTLLGPMLLELQSVMQSVPTGTIVGVQGDTLTTFAGALTARQCGHPVVHVEAGLRTNRVDRPYPEEWIRRAVTQMATWHCAPTSRACANLEREGAKFLQHSGNTGVDALWHDMPRVLPVPKAKRVLVTCHRRENWLMTLPLLVSAVEAFAHANPEVSVLWPVHPNPIVQNAVSPLFSVGNVLLTTPAERHDFLMLLWKATVVVTDSGGVIEEATTLGRSTLIIRDETERPEAIESGCAVLVPQHAMRNLPGLITSALHAPSPKPSDVFGDGTSGTRIAELMLSLHTMHG